jgi:hypothetical protein
MTPEELDRARLTAAEDEAGSELQNARPEVFALRVLDIYRRHVVSNWQPTPKPSPRVVAMREYLEKVDGGRSPSSRILADRGHFDKDPDARAFLAGYAAAVKEAEPIVGLMKHSVENQTWTPYGVAQALTTYLTAIGDE